MFGLIALSLTFTWVLISRRPLRGWGLGVVVGTGLAIALAMVGVSLAWGIAGILDGAGLGAIVGAVLTRPRVREHTLGDDFDATHRHDNLAIDERTGKLWVREADGREIVLGKYQVQEWGHRYVANGPYKARNRIELRVQSLERPLLVAPFNRYRDNIWGAPKNARDAEEWHARLSAFLRQ